MKTGPVMDLFSSAKAVSIFCLIVGFVLVVSSFFIQCNKNTRKVNGWHWVPVILGVLIICMGGVGIAQSMGHSSPAPSKLVIPSIPSSADTDISGLESAAATMS